MALMNQPDDTFLTTREVASLLRIKERKVYDLAASNRIPCRKITGKLLFPRQEVLLWLNSKTASSRLVPDTEKINVPASADSATPMVFLGSHDPLLEAALRESGSYIPTYFESSLDGLRSFEQGRGSIVGLHIMENSLQQWNIGLVASRLGAKPIVVLEWARRRRGIIFRRTDSSDGSGKPLISDTSDINQLGFVARQSGAGSQQLFESLLQSGRFGEGTVVDTVRTALTEQEAATDVLEGKADFAFGLLPLAKKLGLQFLPVVEETFDLMLYRKTYFEPEFQKLVAFCHGNEFRQLAENFGGYDIAANLTVRYNGSVGA